jgi:adenylate cyclase class IV
MKFKEIESKYHANEIKMADFIRLMEELNPNKKLTVSSYDDYFINEKDDFIRYRHNDDVGELTIKRKINPKNNIERVEINLPIAESNFLKIKEFVSLLGYRHNFTIYKTCKIYWIDNKVISYYMVYDENIKELGRFIEIEADETHEWKSEKEALEEINKFEKLLLPLGLNNKNRLRKSLFEMFRKGNNNEAIS